MRCPALNGMPKNWLKVLAAIGRARQERQAEEGRPRNAGDAVGPAGHAIQFSSTMRTISPKPSVTMAR